MELHVADHPLIHHKMTVLRDEKTPAPIFRQLVAELVTLLSYEATRNMRTEPVSITTPVAPAEGVRVAKPLPLAVPIIRAGLGMLDGFLGLVPICEVGFVGIRRNEHTLQPETYAKRLPEDLAHRQCFVLDPMLATGGSLAATVRFLLDAGAADITAICLVAAPEGLDRMRSEFPDAKLRIVAAALDRGLNDVGYIVPGLGDAGDRLYGVVD